MASVTLEDFGTALRLECADAELLAEALRVVALPSTRQTDGPAATFRLQTPRENGSEFYSVSLDGRHLLADRALEGFLEALERDFHIQQALLSPWLFVHAGVVAWEGHAIVLPGPSYTGKSTLVAALLERGARYLSDEFAVLDEQGRAWPFPRALSLRGKGRRPVEEPAREAVPVGVIACLEHRAEGPGEWRPLTPGEASLELFRQGVNAQLLGGRALLLAGRAAGASSLRVRGVRGEAQAAADRLLASSR